jgi:deoxyribose-phosphate aldolase
MSDKTALIEKTVKQVTAILGEARTSPRTGRTRPDVGIIAEGASVTSITNYTHLAQQTTPRDIESLCYEAREYAFASVCVNSVYVPLAAEMLKGTNIAVCTVVGLPLGATLPQVKVYEAQEAIRAGAREIEMVLHIGALKSRDLVEVHEDISDVAVMCHEQGNDLLCKVIIEDHLLTDMEIVIACQIAKVAGADFVKTSTDFTQAGVRTENVALMRAVVGTGVGVEAAGKIRSLAEAQAMIAAGANRIGTSAAITIAQQEQGHNMSTERGEA